jgi:putative acetyltransferase
MGRTAPLSKFEFRRAAAGDAEALVRLMSDEDVISELLQTPYPSVEAWRKRLETQATEVEGIHLVAVHGDEVVASAGIHGHPNLPRLRHSGMLGMSVARPWQGRGVGSEMMRRLLDWADNWMGLLRIELSVYTDNERALALYRKYGFEMEGTLRAFALRRGRYADVYTMARLHPNPPRLRTRTGKAKG